MPGRLNLSPIHSHAADESANRQERADVCITRLVDELSRPEHKEVHPLLRDHFQRVADNRQLGEPEDITRNLLFMHSKNFLFNQETVTELLSSASSVKALAKPDLFFKGTSTVGVAELPTRLSIFWQSHREQTTHPHSYFGLKAFCQTSFISCRVDALPRLIGNSLTLEISVQGYWDRVCQIEGVDEGYHIDFPSERVVRGFRMLYDAGYRGPYTKYLTPDTATGRTFGNAHGLTDRDLLYLANINNPQMASKVLSGEAAVSNSEPYFFGRYLSLVIVCHQVQMSSSPSMDASTQVQNSFVAQLTPEAVNTQILTVKPDLKQLQAKLVHLRDDGVLANLEQALRIPQDSLPPALATIVEITKTRIKKQHGLHPWTYNRPQGTIDYASALFSWPRLIAQIPLEKLTTETILLKACFEILQRIYVSNFTVEFFQYIWMHHIDEAAMDELVQHIQDNQISLTNTFDQLLPLLQKYPDGYAKLKQQLLTHSAMGHTPEHIKQLKQWLNEHPNQAPEVVAKIRELITWRLLQLMPRHSSTGYNRDTDPLRKAFTNIASPSAHEQATYEMLKNIRKRAATDFGNQQYVEELAQTISNYIGTNPKATFAKNLNGCFGSGFWATLAPPLEATAKAALCAADAATAAGAKREAAAAIEADLENRKVYHETRLSDGSVEMMRDMHRY